MHQIARETCKRGSVQISSMLLDRGYSFELIFGAINLELRGEFAKPIDILAIVQKYIGQFNSLGPWNLGPSSSVSNAGSERKIFGQGNRSVWKEHSLLWVLFHQCTAETYMQKYCLNVDY